MFIAEHFDTLRNPIMPVNPNNLHPVDIADMTKQEE